MQVKLKLLPTEPPQREAVAWLVLGSSCAQWLGELTSWNCDLADAQLYHVPVGLLVVPSQRTMPQTSPTALPYGALAGNMYVPVEASLNATVSASELRELFPPESLFVWHPSAGLWQLQSASALRLDDLLQALPRRDADWSRAEPGTALNSKILSLLPDEALHSDQMWQSVRDDIGSESPTRGNLPRATNEPSDDVLSKLGRSVKGQMAEFLKWLSQPGAVGASGRAAAGAAGGMFEIAGGLLGQWGSGLAQWMNDQLHKWSEALEEERHREVSRLLHMLQSDPDAGLRFAIPFNNEPGRGLAMPGSRLMERDVNFRLGGSGGPVDAWNINHEYRQKLVARYRELANREIALGRHRRAAYIFAHLLGDYVSAARTLVDGRHYREAAALYEEKLTQPLEAARALEQGGLWSEAIAIYERLGQDEKVGDLYLQIEQPEPAATAYRRAVTTSLRTDDRLSAARILEAKLAVPDEAYETLVHGWPDSGQAIRCVEALFQLLGRLGQHERASLQVRRLAQCTASQVGLSRQLAQSYAGLAESYPSIEVRSQAADQTRLLAAEHLEEATGADLTGFTEALRKLAPHDRLLIRDTQRFVQDVQRRIPKAARVRKPTLSIVRQIHLVGAKWSSLIATGSEFYVAGVQNKHFLVARSSWQGNVQIASNSSWLKRQQEEFPILLAAHERFGQVVVHAAFENALEGEAIIPATGNLPRVVVGSHPGLGGLESKQFTMAMAYTDRGTFDVLKADDLTGDLIWATHALLSPNLLGTYRIDPKYAFPEEHLNRFPIVLFSNSLLYCAGGLMLNAFDSTGLRHSVQLPGIITRLSSSRPFTRQRIVASLADGGAILWGDNESAPRARFGEGLANPYTCITSGGLLIVAADGMIEVYDTRETKLTQLAIKAEPSCLPCGLVATDQPHEFALLNDEESVLVMRVEGWS
jgi:tetratricopeptide (TPR) repeat protein